MYFAVYHYLHLFVQTEPPPFSFLLYIFFFFFFKQKRNIPIPTIKQTEGWCSLLSYTEGGAITVFPPCHSDVAHHFARMQGLPFE